MYICPQSGTKLRLVRAKGGRFWVSVISGGRLLTHAMVKRFLGEYEAREIWMRAESGKENPGVRCPGCTRPMRAVQEPGWIGSFELDVCRSCHLVWFDRGEHSEIPHPEDFDPQVLKVEKRVAKTEVKVFHEEKKLRDEALFGDGPDGWLQALPAFIGLPVEMNRPAPPWPVLTAFLVVAMIFLHVFFGQYSQNVVEYGFYPGEFFKNYGLNIYFSAFLHADWFHLLGNVYFFGMLGDDVEDDVGAGRFLLMIFFTVSLTAVIWTFASASPQLPHVGISGVVMALMAYYAMRFPKARLAYIVPALHYLNLGGGGFGYLRGFRWLRLPVVFVFVAYIGYNLFGYFALELNHFSSISFSAHLIGFLIGLVFGLTTENKELRV